MIHGWPDTYRLWDKQVEHLKSRYRCVRFTVPGFDRTHERRRRTLAELSAFIDAVVQKVSPDRKVILLLHDWGCVFGYRYYLDHPERVARIIGVDVGDLPSLERALSLPAKLGVFTYQMTLALAWVLGGDFGDGLTRKVANGMHCPSDTAPMGSHMTYPYVMTWFGGRHSYRRESRAFEPACPMLFVYGRRKPFMFHAPDWIDRLLSRKGNRVEAFDTNHWVMLKQPERFNEVVGEWLAATEAAA
jgi:pimeloyl-ACP methyl ester carboxylesterase